jgi:uncharacterized tellurite resistance protein B-like protein
MNFSDFITDHGKRVIKEHFIHLIQVAQIDGKISQSEMDLLHKQGRKFGLTDPEIDILIKSESLHHYDPPYSLHHKFDQLYNIAEMILSDSEIADSEKSAIKRYAIAVGFKDKHIDGLIDLLLKGIMNNQTEDSLLSEFKNLIFKD